MFALKHKIMNSSNNNHNNGGGGGKGDGSVSSSKNTKEKQLFSKSKIVPKVASTGEVALEISDIMDDDESDLNGSIHSSVSAQSSNQSWSRKLSTVSKPIDIETAKKLKILLLGDATKPIGSEWCFQYLDFDTRVPELWYGLVQHQGGPCGLLATVQGYLCAEFFHLNQVDLTEKTVDLDNYRYKCLAKAIANLLWQIGGHKQKAIVAFESSRVCPSRIQLPETTEFAPDGITEHIRISTEYSTNSELADFLSELFSYDRQSIGCVSLAYSCILTRGLDQIKLDYDSGSIESLLTPERLLCTQELVNLALVGRAVSNVFDRNFAISSDMILQGINRQSLIGFLTIHEHEGAFKVGACYKNPKLPIYLVLSDYHFTLLFSKQKCEEASSEKGTRLTANNSTKFDLFYYDGLLGQDHEVRLTIDTEPKQQPNDLLPSEDCILGACPIEYVLRTKWPNAAIDWNGSSKIF